MKTTLTLLALALTAIAGSAQVTYENPSAPSYSMWTDVLSTQHLGQTFTGVEHVIRTSWHLANFETDTTKTAEFKMYIYAWDGANTVGSAVYASPSAVSLTQSNVGGVMDFQPLTFTPGVTLSASSTYIMVLIFNSGDEAFTLGETFPVADGAFFSSGTEFNVSGPGPSGGAFSGSWSTPDYDLGVSITVGPAPVPEPKTAAAGLAGLFVVGLIGRQLWLRRKTNSTVSQAVS